MKRGVQIGPGPSDWEARAPAYDLIENREFLRRFGITRVGDITDLDIIGVPVWFAVRPNSRGVSVSQGKGLTREQARVSAVMEAIEGAVAEETGQHIREYGSVNAMSHRGFPIVPLEKIARVDVASLDPTRERAWVEGYSVRTGNAIFAPYELIGMDFRATFPWDRQTFHMSSHGLAAGFDYDRTVMHALLELVEDEACFALDVFETRKVRLRRLNFPIGTSHSLDQLLERLAAVGISPQFFDLTTGLGVPVVLANLTRPLNAPDGPGSRIAGGIACRLDVYEAAKAALLEAIQSRLTDISGARDDISALRYHPDRSVRNVLQQQNEMVGTEFATPAVESAPGWDWRRLSAHLFRRDVGDIYVFPLKSMVSDIIVIRVVAENLAAIGGAINQFSASALDSFLRP